MWIYVDENITRFDEKWNRSLLSDSLEYLLSLEEFSSIKSLQ